MVVQESNLIVDKVIILFHRRHRVMEINHCISARHCIGQSVANGCIISEIQQAHSALVCKIFHIWFGCRCAVRPFTENKYRFVIVYVVHPILLPT